MKLFKKEHFFLLIAWFIFAIWGIIARKIDVPIPISLTIITFFGMLTSWFFIKSKITFNIKALTVAIILVADLIFLFLAFKRISFSTTISVHYAGPVLVMVLSPLILKEKFKPINLLYSLIGLLSVFVLLREESQLQRGGSEYIVYGIIFACLSSITLALNIIYQRLNMKSDQDYGLAVFQYNLYMFIIFALIITPLWYFLGFENNLFEIKELHSYIWLAIAGILTQGVAMLLFNSAIRFVDSQTVAKMAFIEVVFVSVFGFFLYREIPTNMQIVGIISIIFVVYKTTKKQIKDGFERKKN